MVNKFGVQYLGEWHKHAVADTPRASSTDRRTMRAIARKPAYDITFPILLIANEDGRTITVYVSDSRRVTLVRVQHAIGHADPALSRRSVEEEKGSR